MWNGFVEWLYDEPQKKIETGGDLIWLGSRMAAAGIVVLILITMTARLGGHFVGLSQAWPSWAAPVAFSAAYAGMLMMVTGWLLRRHGRRVKSQF